jgi:hypothetical protein
MTASSGVVISNLAYLLGAVLLAIIGGLVVWLRHRQPRSVDANVESFQRGLRALAPDSPGPKRGAPRTVARPPIVQSRPAVSVVDVVDPEVGDARETDSRETGAQTG